MGLTEAAVTPLLNQGVTRAEIARRLNVNPSALSRWLARRRGGRRPRKPISPGDRLGALTAVAPTSARTPKGRYVVWLCRCDCGAECRKGTQYLLTTKHPACGDCRPRGGESGRLKDIKGRRSGRLVAEYDTGESSRHGRLWHCRCDCGGSRVVPASQVKQNLVRSCGCVPRGRKKKVEKNRGKKAGTK